MIQNFENLEVLRNSRDIIKEEVYVLVTCDPQRTTLSSVLGKRIKL